MSGFDRISAPDATPRGPRRRDGRHAVFSAPADGPSGLDRWPEVTVTCDRCRRSRGVGPFRLLTACVPFVFVLPWRDHPLLARCPSCARIAWLGVRYPADASGAPD